MTEPGHEPPARRRPPADHDLGDSEPMPAAARSRAERATGRDLAHARLHRGPEADRLARAHGASAFTAGDAVGFRSGAWQPDTVPGQLLVAHELAHVAQQSSASGPTDLKARPDAAAEAGADRLALGAALGQTGLPVVPSRRGLSLSACLEPEPLDFASLEALAQRHLRLVPIDTPETFSYTTLVSKGFVVRASEEPRDTDDIQPTDIVIRAPTAGTDYPRFTALLVEDPIGNVRYSTPTTAASAPGSFVVHFLAQGTTRLTGWVVLSPTLPVVQITREIEVAQNQADVAARFATESDTAAAASLAEEQPRDLVASLTVLRANRALMRGRAAQLGVVDADVLSFWVAFDNTMLSQLDRLEADEAPNNPAEIRQTVSQFLESFADEGGAPATIADTTATMASLVDGATLDAGAILRAWLAIADAFDAWIVEQLRDSEEEGAGEAAQVLEHLTAAAGEEGSLAGKAQLERVAAVFHPSEAHMNAGGIIEVPHVLYTWVEDEQWHLKDLTSPTHTFEYQVAFANEASPPRALFEEVNNNREHFTTGRLHYQVPGQPAQVLETTSPWAWSDYAQVFALALLAIGLVLLGAAAIVGTGGAAAPGLAAAGGYFMVGAAVTGAGAAGMHMYEASERGRLTGTTAAIDVAQMVASLASAGTATLALRAGAAGIAGMSAGSRVAYLGLSATALSGDVVSVTIMTYDGFQQLYGLWQSGATGDELGRAGSLIMLNLAVQGALVGLSARNTIGDFRVGMDIEIRTGADDVLEVADPHAFIGPLPPGAAPAPAATPVTITVPPEWHALPSHALPPIPGHHWSQIGGEWRLFRDPGAPEIPLEFNVYVDAVTNQVGMYNVRTNGQLIKGYTQPRPVGDTHSGTSRLPPELQGTGEDNPFMDADGVVYDKSHTGDYADTPRPRPGTTLSTHDPANYTPGAAWYNRGPRNFLVQQIRAAGDNYAEMAIYAANPPRTADGTAIPQEFIFLHTGPNGEFRNAWRVPNDPALTDRSLGAISPFAIAESQVPTPMIQAAAPPPAAVAAPAPVAATELVPITDLPPPPGVVAGFRGRLEESADPEDRDARVPAVSP